MLLVAIAAAGLTFAAGGHPDPVKDAGRPQLERSDSDATENHVREQDATACRIVKIGPRRTIRKRVCIKVDG